MPSADNKASDDLEVRGWGKWKVMVVNSNNLAAIAQKYESSGADGILISPYNGFETSDLSFLKDMIMCKSIGIVIPYAQNLDVSILREFPQLRFLTLSGSKQTLDLSCFSEIEDLRMDWHPKVSLLSEGFDRLKSLYLGFYKSKSKTLIDFPFYPNLEEIELNQGNIESILGIEKLHSLKSISLYYLKSLKSVKSISNLMVEKLFFQSCKKIEDACDLSESKSLRTLSFVNCGEIDSIGFVEKIKTLEELRIVKTKIVDNNLDPCLNLKFIHL